MREADATMDASDSTIAADAEEPAAGAPVDDDIDYENERDLFEWWIANQRSGRSARKLPGLLVKAMRLVLGADRRSAILALSLQLLAAVLVAAQVLASKNAITAVLKSTSAHAATNTLVLDVAILSAVTAASTLAAAVQAQQQRLLAEQSQRRVWLGLLHVSTQVPLTSFEGPRFYNHLKRVQANSLDQPISVATGLITLVGSAASVIAIAATVFTIQPFLAPILLIAGLPSLYLSRYGSRTEFDFALSQSERYRLREYLRLTLTERNEAKELRAFDLGSVLRERHDTISLQFVDALRRQVRRRQRIALASAAFASLGNAGALAFVVWLLVTHRISLGSAGAAAVAVQLLSSRITQLFSGLTTLYQSGLFLDDLDNFLAAVPPPEVVPPEARLAPTEFETLRFDKVSFTYPGTEVAAVRDVSFAINSGEVVALVGENGSGKTTVAKIVAGLYPPTGGDVRWDDDSVSELDPNVIRDRIAVIFQDYVRYQFSAHENIGFGDHRRLDDRPGVISAAAQARADSFLEQLPNGYDTLLSKEYTGGVDLSIGQWQRVAIARAFFRNAPFIILDEPTSALDARAEDALFADLRRLAAGRTVLFISHRFSTVRSADRILVLDKGRLVENGSHEQLMEKKGLYAELFELQARAYRRRR